MKDSGTFLPNLIRVKSFPPGLQVRVGKDTVGLETCVTCDFW